MASIQKTKQIANTGEMGRNMNSYKLLMVIQISVSTMENRMEPL